MPLPTELRLVIVTPETTLLDEPVSALRFPLFDGQIGVLPGRAPMVGRLGFGELRMTGSKGERSYYVDGGFVQVKGEVVSVLTNCSLTAEQIDVKEAEERLANASRQVAATEAEQTERAREQERARRMLAMAKQRPA